MMGSAAWCRAAAQRAAESRRRTRGAAAVLELVTYAALVRRVNLEPVRSTVPFERGFCTEVVLAEAAAATDPSLAPWDAHARWALSEARTLGLAPN